MSQTARQVNGVEVPPAGTYKLDPHHTTIGFVARHMITKVRGRFAGFEGTVHIAENPEESWVEASIDTATIDSGVEFRDNHLKSEDFLQSEMFPKMTFKSTAIRPAGGTTFELDGDLTIKDITNPITLKVDYLGSGPDMKGETTLAGFSAEAAFRREDWDMTWNMAVETGGFLVGKDIKLEIETEILLEK